MTLPIDTQFPFRPDEIREGGDSMVNYMRELVSELDDKYRDSADNIDGNIAEWTPIVSGSTLAGAGTYVTRNGRVLRQGLRTTVWFNIEFTAHTGTGFLEIALPYKTADYGRELFTGSVELWNVVFPVGTSYGISKALFNSNILRIQMCGTGMGSVALNLPTARHVLLIGSVFYLGQENE